MKDITLCADIMLGDNKFNRVNSCLTDVESTPVSTNVIKAHPDFRMIVLANRPGFPFLGNDFFGSLGKKAVTFFLINKTI